MSSFRLGTSVFCANSTCGKFYYLRDRRSRLALTSRERFVKRWRICPKYGARCFSRKELADCRSDYERDYSTMKIFLISDIHTDYEENLEWIRALSSARYREHVLILAGDVSDSLKTFELTMSLLKAKFREVFFVPGNHDLWCKREEDLVEDSLTKLEKLTEICKALGVLTSPLQVGGVWVVPVLSWYHESFDRERDIEGYNIPPVQKKCSDYSSCKWPPPLQTSDDSIARHFDELNEVNHMEVHDFQAAQCPIISFSHFLPRYELCPEKRMLLYPNLPKMIGSDWLEARVRKIHGQKGNPRGYHLFGHTHLSWDSTIEDIRYIQAPLGYPKERARGQIPSALDFPLCIYDSQKGGLVEGPFPSKWSDYYRSHTRDPDNQELAPWVEGHYQRTDCSSNFSPQ